MSFFNKTKILVVEDEPDIADSLKARLALENYDVVLAKDGKEGVEKARSEKPQLIILDVMLPLINGFDVCKILKGEQATKGIPIIILTALPRVEDAEQALASGADDYLGKPYSNDRLMQKVRKFLPKK